MSSVSECDDKENEELKKVLDSLKEEDLEVVINKAGYQIFKKESI